jgi:putative transposase
VKAKLKLAKKHLKLRNKRNDFLHKVAKKLSENQTVAVENLMIKNMSKKAKGSIDNPNMRASAKSGLNRSILQQSWGKFFEFLEYKLKRNGGQLVKVDPKYTSQKCSCWGHISKANRQTQAKFICTKCHTALNADYNASVNILNAVGTIVKAS